MGRFRATSALVAGGGWGALFFGAPPAHAENDELLPYTTYTIDQGHLALGLLSIDYGLLDGLSIGTDPPAWAARIATPFWIPNLHVKWAFLRTPDFRLAAQVGAYWAGPDHPRNDLSFLAVPVTLFASTPLTSRLEGHLEATYGYIYAWGTGSPEDLTIEGAVAADVLQFGALLTYRVTDVFRLTLRGRLQAYSSPVVFGGDARLDERTTTRMDLELDPDGLVSWMAVPGVAFLWTRVHLWLGLGYGNFFLPGVLYPLPDHHLVPDGTVYVLF